MLRTPIANWFREEVSAALDLEDPIPGNSASLR